MWTAVVVFGEEFAYLVGGGAGGRRRGFGSFDKDREVEYLFALELLSAHETAVGDMFMHT